MQVDPATIPDNGWDMEFDHFWGPVSCDGLFLLFDCSADLNNGVPDVSHDDVIEHVAECDRCQACAVRVTVDVEGLGTLEYLMDIDDDGEDI